MKKFNEILSEAKFKKGDMVKAKPDSDYVEPKDRDKKFRVKNVRNDEIQLDDGSYYPSEEFYKP